MERKIGEIFTCDGKTYQVVKGFSCNDCAFINNGNCYLADKLLGPCAYTERTDKTSIIFKEIKGMEIKNNQLTIDIPEGYEIDKENSTFECIKFKPIKKYLTYKEIAEKLNKDICFFIAKGKIQSYSQYASYDNPGVANSYRQIEKILAINQLMNIAKYYNGDWTPDWSNSKENKFCIKFDYHKDRLYVDYNNSIGAGDVFFKKSEDAQAVIDNPNFRDILDTIYNN